LRSKLTEAYTAREIPRLVRAFGASLARCALGVGRDRTNMSLFAITPSRLTLALVTPMMGE
jgi:hypothetical protein